MSDFFETYEKHIHTDPVVKPTDDNLFDIPAEEKKVEPTAPGKVAEVAPPAIDISALAAEVAKLIQAQSAGVNNDGKESEA